MITFSTCAIFVYINNTAICLRSVMGLFSKVEIGFVHCLFSFGIFVCRCYLVMGFFPFSQDSVKELLGYSNRTVQLGHNVSIYLLR